MGHRTESIPGQWRAAPHRRPRLGASQLINITPAGARRCDGLDSGGPQSDPTRISHDEVSSGGLPSRDVSMDDRSVRSRSD